MSIRALYREPHRVLREPARRIETFGEDIRALVADLIETMHAHDGVGLAAPQIGRGVQVFVVNPTQQRGRELVVVNPTLGAVRGRTTVTEGCLSLPSIWGRVKRAVRVQLRGQDASGAPLTLTAEGLLAVVLQHEYDHLHGRLFIDRLSWLQRRRLRYRLANSPHADKRPLATCV